MTLEEFQKLEDEAKKVHQGNPKAVEAQILAEHIRSVHANVRAQLDILRKTRGQREVGSVKIPVEFQAPVVIDVDGVEQRSGLLPISGAKE